MGYTLLEELRETSVFLLLGVMLSGGKIFIIMGHRGRNGSRTRSFKTVVDTTLSYINIGFGLFFSGLFLGGN